MTIKLVEEFIYDVSEKRQEPSDALKDVFGTSDIPSLLEDIRKNQEQVSTEILGKRTISTTEDIAAEQALAVSQKLGGITVGGQTILHEQLVKMLTDPKFRQILVSMRSMKDPVVRPSRGINKPGPLVARL